MSERDFDYFVEVFYHGKHKTEMTGFIGYFDDGNKSMFIPIRCVNDWDYIQSKVKR